MGENQAGRYLAVRALAGLARLGASYGHFRHYLRTRITQGGGVCVVSDTWIVLRRRIRLGTRNVVRDHAELLASTEGRMMSYDLYA